MPEADQQIAGKADQFPRGQHGDPVARQHQRLHRRDKQQQDAEKARPFGVAAHVTDGIDQHTGRHRRHHSRKHRRQRRRDQPQRHLRQPRQDQLHGATGNDPRQQRHRRDKPKAGARQRNRFGCAPQHKRRQARQQRRKDNERQHRHPFNSRASSISTDPRTRNRAMAMAKPTAISTAITAITIRTNI